MELIGDFTEARGNLVHGNTGAGTRAMRVSNGAVARDNRVFANQNVGIETSVAKVLDNVIYSNATGILVGATGNLIANNLVYANTTVGLDYSGSASSTVINNTFFQPAGDAIRESSSGSTLVDE